MKRSLLTAITLLAVAGCGDRPASWDEKAQLPLKTAGLTGSVAVVDTALDRVLMLSASSDRSLHVAALGVGKNVVTTEVSRDSGSLFVLSKGVQPRRNPDDELPSLTVIDGSSQPKVTARYTLTDPLQGIAVDPQGEWAVVYDAGGIVVNPNELIFVKLSDPNFEPVSKTLRSFGGAPSA